MQKPAEMKGAYPHIQIYLLGGTSLITRLGDNMCIGSSPSMAPVPFGGISDLRTLCAI